MITRIIEILKDISEGKTPPKKILFKGSIFEYANLQQDYYSQEVDEWLFNEYVLLDILNEVVEILEITITYNQDNKIEKLNIALFDDDNLTTNNKLKHIAFRVNEIIDFISKEEE